MQHHCRFDESLFAKQIVCGWALILRLSAFLETQNVQMLNHLERSDLLAGRPPPPHNWGLPPGPTNPRHASLFLFQGALVISMDGNVVSLAGRIRNDHLGQFRPITCC